MAQRFGGKFSKEAATPLKDKQPQKMRSRANLLFFAGLPLLFTAFGDGPIELARHLLAFGAIALAAWLTREGLEAEDAYTARTISRRPAVPRKLLGAGFVATGVVLASIDTSIVGAVLYGIIAAVLHVTAFGLDPMKDKGVEGSPGFQADRVLRAVDEAENHLEAMMRAIETVGDRPLMARVEQFQATARTMFRAVENDPRELTAARRYLGVYLLGAKEATEKFVKLFKRSRDEAARTEYSRLLDDLEANFAARTDKTLLSGRTDLDIEISVLRDRLQREGISPK